MGIVSLGAVLLMWGCSNFTSASDRAQNSPDSSDQLVELLERSIEDPDAQVVIVEQLIQDLRKQGRHERIKPILTSLVVRNPNNPYNAYYLTLIAEHLRRNNRIESAKIYYYRAAYRYPDVTVLGSSVHHRALQALVQHTSNPADNLQHYQAIQSRFAGKIDPGVHHYNMARAFEQVGKYDEAFEEYRRFISYPDTRIPGRPSAHNDVLQLLAFKESRRNWTWENLDDLVREIQTAIATRNMHRLVRNRAQANFFAMSWKQDAADQNAGVQFDLGPFLLRNRIRYASELEPQSNAREAYLWTSGWEARIPTWYLYFRKIDYPADPNIHNNWEWAGIYFGELL